MTTTKSFSESGRMRKLYAATFRRQLPFAIISTVLVFAMMVLPYLVDAPSHEYYSSVPLNAESLRVFYTGRFQGGVYIEQELGGVVAIFLGVMAFAGALASSRYLHSKKMTDLYHSLPLTRGQLLLTNLAASLSAILGPFALLYLATAIGQQIGYGRYGCFGAAYLKLIVFDFFFTALFVLVIYLVTTLVAVNVGTSIDALMITGALGFLPSLVYVVGGFLWSAEYYGAVFFARKFLTLNPFLFFMTKYTHTQSSHVYDAVNGFSYWESVVDYRSLLAILIGWLVVAALLLVASLLCYRRRRSEVAGQTLPGGVLQLITKCFACFLGGSLTLAAFYDRSMPVRLLAILIGGVCIGLVAELFLSRSVKFLRRNLLWLAGTGAVCCAAFLLLHLDPLGYIGRVPEAGQVDSVRINYGGRGSDSVGVATATRYGGYYYSDGSAITLTDPGAIAIVTGAHRATVADRSTNDSYLPYDIYANVEIVYSLRGGGTLARTYYQMDEAAYRQLADLEANPDFLTQTYPLYVLDRYLLGGQSDYVRSAAYVDVLGNVRSMSLSAAEMEELIEAMKLDALDQPLETMTEPTSSTTGFVRLRYDQSRIEVNGVWLNSDDLWVELGDWSTRTAAFLSQRGIDTAPDLTSVRAAYLTAGSNSSRRVATVTPEDALGYEYSLRNFLGGEDYYYVFVVVEDEAAIRAIHSAAYNTALYDASLGGVVTVIYELEDGEYGAQNVLTRDLPDAIREQVEQTFSVQLLSGGDSYAGEYFYYDSWDIEYAVEVAEDAAAS